jgi:hypothetical protein
VALLVLPLAATGQFAPAMASWRRTFPTFVPLPDPQAILKIGDYVVGKEGDPQLSGHPDIRY